MKKFFLSAVLFSLACLCFTGCYSVFSGGTGGLIVDAESTSNPKAGIANVDVYAYIDESDRDNDFAGWREGSVFVPHAEYYGHTTTSNSGAFTISRLVWKDAIPAFGRDADYTDVFFLFYHENYGLTKGTTVIISDGTTDTVYAELTKTRKTIPLTLNFIDVSNHSSSNIPMEVEISVPQTNGRITGVSPKVYKASVSGTGIVNISFPRYSYAANGARSNNEPIVTINYYQSDENATWKACYNGDSQTSDYAFRDLAAEPVQKKIPDYSAYSVSLYGKASKIYFPVFSGTYHSTSAENGDAADDGKLIEVKLSDGTLIGSSSTYAAALGNTATRVHGTFNIPGSDYYFDDTYTDRVVKKQIKFYVNGSLVTSSISEISSDKSSYNVSLK